MIKIRTTYASRDVLDGHEKDAGRWGGGDSGEKRTPATPWVYHIAEDRVLFAVLVSDHSAPHLPSSYAALPRAAFRFQYIQHAHGGDSCSNRVISKVGQRRQPETSEEQNTFVIDHEFVQGTLHGVDRPLARRNDHLRFITTGVRIAVQFI